MIGTPSRAKSYVLSRPLPFAMRTRTWAWSSRTRTADIQPRPVNGRMSDMLRRQLDVRRAHVRVEEELRRLEQAPKRDVAVCSGEVVGLVQRRQKTRTGEPGSETEVQHCRVSAIGASVDAREVNI